MYSKGFSLIELLVVMGILAILASAALPAYDKYIVKARVMQLLSAADIYKIKLLENMYSGETAKAKYTLNTDLIEHIALDSLVGKPHKHIVQVVAKMKNQHQAGIGISATTNRDPLAIQFQGIDNGEMINWTCHVASEYHEYVPQHCKNADLEKINIG